MPQRRKQKKYAARRPKASCRARRKPQETWEIVVWALACAVLLLLVIFLYRRQEQQRRAVYENAEFSVHFIDVGQGDSIYIHSGDADVLIDAGEAEYGSTVVRYLDSCGVRELDLVIATHPHSDHIGGLSAVLSEFEIQEVMLSDIPDEQLPVTRTFAGLLDAIDASGAALVTAEAGQTYTLGDAVLTILGPVDTEYDDLNDYSVVAQLSFGEADFLFTGDQTTTAEKDLLAADIPEDIEVLKVGHHGSSTSSSKKFLDVIQPEYAVIQCGADNSYSHPHETIVKRLAGYTDNIYRTDVQGTAVFTSDGRSLSVSLINE